jgi:hypothetical protein
MQSASAAERDVAVLRGSKTDEVVAPPAVPVLVRQPSRFLQQGIFFEFGARYWLSSGTFAKDLFVPPSVSGAGGLVSRLTYSGVTSNSVELFGSIKQVDALFLKWNVGFGKSSAGSLVDEDFPPFILPYSRTSSDQGDGSLGFATIDLGYNFVGWSTFQIGGFVGYNFLRETVNATGCAQQAGNPDICASAISTGVLGVSERADWSSFRVGVAADWLPFNRFKLSASAAWLPFTTLNSRDTHALRADLPGDTFEGARGSGAQIEGLASYAFSDSFNIGVGARYWYMRANGNRELAFLPAGLAQPASFKSERFGVFLQGAYTFGVPGRMHRPQWLSCC